MGSDFFTIQKYRDLTNKHTKLTPSMEDYLEMIYRMYLNNTSIRVNSLSKLLNVRMSSTTKIIQRLNKLEYVKYEKYGAIYLSDKGKEIGEFLYNRHNIINEFLSIMIDNSNLLKSTEIIEHYISDELLINIKYLTDFFTNNPDILEKFNSYRENLL